MIASVDSATDVHFRADGPVLLEVGVIANNGGRIDTLFLPDLIGAAVRLESAV